MQISFVRLPSYAGIQLVSDPHMVDVIEDWSKVRSPARAARRRRHGHPQRIRYREVPKPGFLHLPAQNLIVAHPETIAGLQARLKDHTVLRRDGEVLDTLLGQRR
ncbi:hypothetical protein [Methylobacterium brachiatum]|uniref:hypothetical protein n=1 Tax=Methylobacterium brachiatum TaxID=269660 RepID=UPI002448CF42|nr:hypothetical protein [Methylobacterium brachiatum]MDH2313118.1 hypothetical protein [Methylobacterium brachiatum]